MTGTFVERVWEVTPLESEIRQAIDQLSNTQPLKSCKKKTVSAKYSQMQSKTVALSLVHLSIP